TGGKTGTAQKDVPVIDPKTGEPMKKIVIEKDPKGKIIGQHQETVFYDKKRSDAWYLSFAPLEKPVMAMAVLLEGPGPGISFYGGKNAAPIAAQLMPGPGPSSRTDRKSTRLNSSHRTISYAVFCLKKKTNTQT